ncbi:MAG: transketolase [Clostridia bacterium]|nr:transketolase [Clostridia bacterium]
MNNNELAIMATKVRKGIVTAVYSASSGHPGGSLSAADMYTYLYFERMNIDPKNPDDPNRDRFVLSKGHTSPGLYSTLANRGYFDVEELTTFRKLGTRLQGHPCMNETPGVDMSSGSLGQGLSVAAGMALAAKLDNKDYKVYCLCGDGEIQEGQIWEAAMFSGANKLNNLTVIVDNNGLQIDGPVADVCSVYPIEDKFKAFNFNVITINGNDMEDIRKAFAFADEPSDKPTCIVMKTTKGKGVSFMENQVGWHGTAPNKEQYEQAIAELDEQLKSLEA